MPVTNCTFVGCGLCQAGAVGRRRGGLPSGSGFGDPVSFKMGVCFISPLDLGPKKSHAGKTERYTIHQGPVKLRGREMRKLQTAERAEKTKKLIVRGVFFYTAIPI